MRALDAEGLAEFGGTDNLGSDVRAAVHRMQMHVALEAFRGDHRKVRIVFEHPPMEEYVARSERSSAALT